MTDVRTSTRMLTVLDCPHCRLTHCWIWSEVLIYLGRGRTWIAAAACKRRPVEIIEVMLDGDSVLLAQIGRAVIVDELVEFRWMPADDLLVGAEWLEYLAGEGK